MKHELETFTIRHILERSAERHAQRLSMTIIGDDETAITFGDLKRKVDAMATYLMQEGVSSGDKVAILGESQPMWGVAFLAVVSAGAIAVPILPDFSSREIETIINHCEARALVVSTKMFEKVSSFWTKEDSLLMRMEDLFHIPLPISTTITTTAPLTTTSR